MTNDFLNLYLLFKYLLRSFYSNVLPLIHRMCKNFVFTYSGSQSFSQIYILWTFKKMLLKYSFSYCCLFTTINWIFLKSNFCFSLLLLMLFEIFLRNPCPLQGYETFFLYSRSFISDLQSCQIIFMCRLFIMITCFVNIYLKLHTGAMA
jgi:hypothetical protein